MSEKKRFSLPPYVMLMLISIVMSFAIAGVYALTKDTIEAAALAAQEQARAAVMEGAAYMEELPLAEGAPVDYTYAAYDAAGDLLGFVSQITVVGFGGEIEVTVGMDTAAAVTAIEVGGKDFSETSGLGARTREPAFKDQFRGASGMLILKQNIDSVTGASISSGAVVSGVNKAVDYMKGLLPEDMLAGETEELPLTEAQVEELTPGARSFHWMGGGSGIDGWWMTDNGYIVRATGFGEGPIAVTVGFDNDGTVTGVIVGDENFMETEGRGDGVLADWYKAQFIGRSGAQTYGEDIDAISGATVTSEATLMAINACMAFDPVRGESDAPMEDMEAMDGMTGASVTEEPSGETDGVTAASPVEEAEPMAGMVMDGITEASPVEEEAEPMAGMVMDGVTEASIVEEEAEPMAGMAEVTVTATAPAISGVLLEPDGVTAASVPEEESAPPSAPGWDPVRADIRPAPAVDGVTAASAAEEPESDGVTEASVPEEEPVPDGVTGASIPEE